MAQVQCPNCQMYKVASRGYTYTEDSTGKIKTLNNGCIVIFLALVGLLLIGAGLFFLLAMQAYIYTIVSVIFFVGVSFALKNFLFPSTPRGYTKYEEVRCLVCGKEWRIKTQQ